MFSTKELEQYIKHEMLYRLKDVNWEKVNFKEGNENSIEGTYIFFKDGKYHVLFTEKGKVKVDMVTSKKEEVLWNVLDIFSFDIAVQYARENRVKGKDFRRALFKKEVEIYSLFGEQFKEKKISEIEEILKKNPYDDI